MMNEQAEIPVLKTFNELLQQAERLGMPQDKALYQVKVFDALSYIAGEMEEEDVESLSDDELREKIDSIRSDLDRMDWGRQVGF